MSIRAFLLLRCNRKDSSRKFLIVLLQKRSDIYKLSIDRCLKFFQGLDRQFDLREGKVEYSGLINNFCVFPVDVENIGAVPHFIVDLALKVLVEREDVPLLHGFDVETENLQIDFFLLVRFLFLLRLSRTRCLVIIDFFLDLHRLKVQNLKHFCRDSLVFYFFGERVVDCFSNYGDGVGMESSVESTFDNFAIFQWILSEDLMDVLLGCFDSEILKVSGRILLLEYLQKCWVFDVELLHGDCYTSALGPILMWNTWLSAIFLRYRTLIIIQLITASNSIATPLCSAHASHLTMEQIELEYLPFR